MLLDFGLRKACILSKIDRLLEPPYLTEKEDRIIGFSHNINMFPPNITDTLLVLEPPPLMLSDN